MFNRNNKIKSQFEKQFDDLSKRIDDLHKEAYVDWEELNRLQSARSSLTEDYVKLDKSALSKDAILTVAGNLLGIGLIVGHERAHVIASKALSFVLKAR